ncbi:MAG TPA: hypothetical protein VE152_04425 [Acidimicrobiales bacterium]|nr:hypothetical protein [Acidimicrobiales bacterium]
MAAWLWALPAMAVAALIVGSIGLAFSPTTGAGAPAGSSPLAVAFSTVIFFGVLELLVGVLLLAAFAGRGPGPGDDGGGGPPPPDDPDTPPWWPSFEADFRRYLQDQNRPVR